MVPPAAPRPWGRRQGIPALALALPLPFWDWWWIPLLSFALQAQQPPFAQEGRFFQEATRLSCST
ncbi:hypothetical protein NW813_13495 [Synechococcus sp. R55.6]|uniref:hypothetical protein n=1 Tax=Synechococcus sp. R55.6 TaxID=2964499 RepID=UPI0039C077AF